MRTKVMAVAAALLLASTANAEDAFVDSCFGAEGTRTVIVEGKLMAVVNPNTPHIVATKKSTVDRRVGGAVRYENNAWRYTHIPGSGTILENKVFGDQYVCSR